MRKTISIIVVLCLFTLMFTGCGQGVAAPLGGEEGYRLQELSTQRDGLNIYGYTVFPAGYTSGKLPVVIFSHGFMCNSETQQDIAIKLAESGIASYCFDYCGGAPKELGCKSDGVFDEMTIDTEKADLNAVIDFIKQQEFTDVDNIYLFGESLGGTVAALVAAQRPEDIKAQVLFYPAFSTIEQAKIIFKTAENVPDRAPTAAEGVFINGTFYKVAMGIEIYDEIAPYEGPVLMFQGDADDVVPKYFVDEAMQYYKNAELVVYEGEGHVFSQKYEDMAVELMIEFIKNNY